MIKAASAKQQGYLDLAAYYAGRAEICYGHEMWPEAATHYGSALESLLRIRFGSAKLANLVEKFDEDPMFECIAIQHDSTRLCPTCVADHVRKLRNAVHPDCWRMAAKNDVDLAASIVMMVYHAMVVCETKVALFQDSLDTSLQRAEAEGKRPQPFDPHDSV
jgi:hypothetical protein